MLLILGLSATGVWHLSMPPETSHLFIGLYDTCYFKVL